MINVDELKALIKGEVETSDSEIEMASHDASIFEVRPQAVVYPKDVEDVKKLVHYVSEKSKAGGPPALTLTGRLAGTDMSGGPLTESLVVSFLRHFNQIKEVKEESQGHLSGDYSKVEITGYAVTEPGVYYRDFEKATLSAGGRIMPSYPASRELCTVGGMVANNAGGEKTLRYGKTELYVRRLKMVCADGNEYEFKPLNTGELTAKKSLSNFEGQLYRKMSELIDSNFAKLQAAKPAVSKNSCGYFLWNVRDKTADTFDLTKLIVGSQGTLGLITEIEYGLVKLPKYSHLLVVFLTDLKQLGQTASKILVEGPESFESYDDQTLKVAFKFLPQLLKQMGGNLLT
ncbi:MAG: FAD-binding oxidoreductase, partial [Candidatus Paceibacterota bacterium]